MEGFGTLAGSLKGGAGFWHFGSESTTFWPVLDLHNTARGNWVLGWVKECFGKAGGWCG